LNVIFPMAEPTTTPDSAAAENGSAAEHPAPEAAPAQAPAPQPESPPGAHTPEAAPPAPEQAAAPPEPEFAVTDAHTPAAEPAPAEVREREEPAKEPKKEKKARKEPAAPQEPAQAEAQEPAEPAPPAEESKKRWYVVKVQSGREESIKEAIERRVKIEGLEDYFGQIIIPVERVTEMVRGKRVVKEKKLYPGYLMVEVEYNDRMLYLFRETSGVGDFVGGGLNHPPQPMKDKEVERMKGAIPTGREVVPPKPPIDRGDRVRVRDGIFAGMEGEVRDILEAKGAVKVELTIFGRPVTHELEYWQVESLS
jgi:transcriptional antiterminator NusG